MNDSGRVIPNLFIVGAPKCGTTAMHTYLGQHPEIFMGKKESHHFATDLIPLTDPFRSDQNYFELFKDAGDRKVIGESSVFYMLSKAAAQNIYRFNPESKIIIMLRNPVDMLQSLHGHQIYNRNESIKSFEAALNAEQKRKSGQLKIKRKLRFNNKLFYSEVAAYTEQVQRYLSLFGAKQVHVIIFDDFKSDTAGVYKKVLEFLNVNPVFQTDFKVVNPHKIRRFRFLLTAVQKPLITKMLPGSMRESLYLFLKDREIIYKELPPMKTALRKRLQEQYKPEVEKLSLLLERDLNYWCKE